MRESHGPRVSKVAAGISLDRMEFSTLRMAERGMRKSISSWAMSCVATAKVLDISSSKYHRGRRERKGEGEPWT